MLINRVLWKLLLFINVLFLITNKKTHILLIVKIADIDHLAYFNCVDVYNLNV